MTLEQLKALSDMELREHWKRGRFPFDTMSGCGSCLTMHRLYSYCHQSSHVRFVAEVRSLYTEPISVMHDLKPNLEEIFALRLYFADLYQNPVPADALEAEVTHQPEPILT